MSPLVKTKSQAYFKDFKRFRAFKGLVEQRNVVFNSFVCKLGLFWHSWAPKTLVSLAFHSKKKTDLQTNSLRKLPTMTDFQIQKVIDTNVSTVISRSRLF
jgi:hypothetical protein